MKLLLDMNLSPRWCEVLADAGLEAAHWSAMGPRGAADSEIMAFAESGDWIVLTHDLDFGAILAATRDHKPSVVQLRGDDISPEAGAETIITALQQYAEELEIGALLTVDLARVRLTLLPLRQANG